MGGFGRLGDELGDGGEFEAGSCPGWLESEFRQRNAALGRCSGHFNTLGFVFIMYDFDEILDFDLDFKFGECGRERVDVNDVITLSVGL